MKRVISLLSILALTVGCLFVLVSCGSTPNSSPKEAEMALKSAGYSVGYTAYEEYTYVRGSSFSEDYIEIYYFNTEADAQDQYSDWMSDYEDEKMLADMMGIDLGYEVGISGTYVWKGTAAAIKAAK